MACLNYMPHQLNVTELSWEKFKENIHLRYNLMPQDIPAICDGCRKKFSVDHALVCPYGGLILARYYDTAKEWGDLGSRDITPSAISYKSLINSRTVYGERTRAGARRVEETYGGGTYIKERKSKGEGDMDRPDMGRLIWEGVWGR